MVTIRLFASLKDVVGCSEMQLHIPGETTSADVFSRLQALHPELSAYRTVVLVAVNQEYAGWEDPVRPGDEVAFFPPVSGGSY